MRLTGKTIGSILVGSVIGSAMLLAQSPQSGNRRDGNSVKIVFALERAKTHLGGGVAISPDGQLFAYIGDDDALYIRSLENGQERPLLREVGPGLDVFSNPAFSPDNKLLIFSVGGGTRYYPSDIYSIKIDGSDLRKLTQSVVMAVPGTVNSAPIFSQYFYAAQYSPDGKKVMLRMYDAIQREDHVALVNRDGGQLEVIRPGVPLFWSNDVDALYYSKDNRITRYLLDRKEDQLSAELKQDVVGKLPDSDLFVSHNGATIMKERLEEGFSGNGVPLDVGVVKSAKNAKKNSAEQQMTLVSMQFATSRRALLTYEGSTIERYEIIDNLVKN